MWVIKFGTSVQAPMILILVKIKRFFKIFAAYIRNGTSDTAFTISLAARTIWLCTELLCAALYIYLQLFLIREIDTLEFGVIGTQFEFRNNWICLRSLRGLHRYSRCFSVTEVQSTELRFEAKCDMIAINLPETWAMAQFIMIMITVWWRFILETCQWIMFQRIMTLLICLRVHERCPHTGHAGALRTWYC